MKNCIVLILLLLFISCKNASNQIGLNENLYGVIIDYQNKYPIPVKKKEKQNSLNYIYTVDFWKEKKDTLVTILRAPAGRTKFDNVYGAYYDNILKPTFIIDNKNLGNKFIIKKIKNKSNWLKKGITSESFPPTHTYLVKDKELKLIKIDTIWKHWD